MKSDGIDRNNQPARATVLLIGVVAIMCGLAGGFIQSLLAQKVSAQTSEDRMLRVRMIELVNGDGQRVGLLGTDSAHNTGLTLFDASGKTRLELRLAAGVSPTLSLKGSDEAPLLAMGLSPTEHPRLMMSDRDFTGRVYLGVAEPDAPDPNWKYDAWVLRFKGNNFRNLVTLGMEHGRSGGLVLNDVTGGEWRTPLK